MNKENLLCSKQHFLYLKGIAILFVVIGHIGNYSGKTWFTPLGGIGVAIFLFCSGYGLMTSYRTKGLSSFWKNKLIAVYVPFVLIEIIAAVIFQRSISNVLLELIFLKRLHPFGWYMQYLVGCYFLFWFGVKYIPNQKVRNIIWSILAGASFFMFGNLQGEQAISFLSGVLLAEYRKERDSLDKVQTPVGENQRKYLLTGGLLLCMTVLLLAVKQLPIVRAQNHYWLTLLNLAMKTSCAAGCLLVTNCVRPLEKMVLWFGRTSYSLYLVHGYYMFIIDNNVLGNYAVNSIVMLVLSLGSAVILNKLNGIFTKKITRGR